MSNRRLNEDGLKFIAKLEGSRSKVYKDVAGLPTIGVGHLLTRAERMSGKIWIGRRYVRYANGLSEEQILALLKQDVRKVENAVNRYTKVRLTRNQFTSLVSFAFNVGNTAFRNSTLLKRVNARRFMDVPAQLRRWKYSGGKIIKGLINRRKKEVSLWNRQD